MLLAVDIGNTTSNFGIFNGQKLLRSFKISTRKNDILSVLNKKFGKNKEIINKIDSVVVGSVVPEYTKFLCAYIKEKLSIEPLVVNPKLNLPIKIKLKLPSEIGADLIANMTAAESLYSKPLVTFDSGTATTFCVLSSKADFLGAAIAPGLELMAKSLSDKTSLLPAITIVKPGKILGQNTVECMQAGIYWGYLGLVKEILRQIKNEHPSVKVIGTGGNISKISENLKEIDFIDQNLTLVGLRIIYESNKK